MKNAPYFESIETSRLWLTTVHEEHHFSTIVGWLNDPEVVLFSDQRHRKHTIDTYRDYLRRFQGSPHKYWFILTREAGAIIGTVSAYIDLPNAVADVGILIGDRLYWQGGYGGEAFAGVIGWLFSSQGVRKVNAGAMASNKGMIGVMRKVGMIEEGRRRRYYLQGDSEVDMILATVFAEDWPISGGTT